MLIYNFLQKLCNFFLKAFFLFFPLISSPPFLSNLPNMALNKHINLPTTHFILYTLTNKSHTLIISIMLKFIFSSFPLFKFPFSFHERREQKYSCINNHRPPFLACCIYVWVYMAKSLYQLRIESHT